MVIQFYDVILRASEETVNENQTIERRPLG